MNTTLGIVNVRMMEEAQNRFSCWIPVSSIHTCSISVYFCTKGLASRKAHVVSKVVGSSVLLVAGQMMVGSYFSNPLKVFCV